MALESRDRGVHNELGPACGPAGRHRRKGDVSRPRRPPPRPRRPRAGCGPPHGCGRGHAAGDDEGVVVVKESSRGGGRGSHRVQAVPGLASPRAEAHPARPVGTATAFHERSLPTLPSPGASSPRARLCAAAGLSLPTGGDVLASPSGPTGEEAHRRRGHLPHARALGGRPRQRAAPGSYGATAT